MRDQFLFVPDVIAGGDAIDAGLVQVGRDQRRQAEAVGRVLAVDDDEIEIELRAQRRQMRDDRVASGSADNVTEKKNLHAKRSTSCSVTSQSSF